MASMTSYYGYSSCTMADQPLVITWPTSSFWKQKVYLQ